MAELTANRDALDLLGQLVAFDTTSRLSNLALIDFLENHLTGLGARCERMLDPTGTKANLHAVLGPDIDGGVVLSGHTDVVPIDGQDWSSDPFAMTQRDDRLYGRGTCDMKGFIACALTAAHDFAAADLKKPVHFAFSYDEEVGCLGAPAMIERMMAVRPKPALAIIGEPTEMKVVTGHKGLYSLRVDVSGHEAHSSRIHDGACAITNMIPLLSFLHAKADEWEKAAPSDSPFDPPFGTITVGQLGGGTASNILAREAWFETLMRPAPWDDARKAADELRVLARALEADMKRHAPDACIHVETRSDAPALAPENDGEAERLARALTGDNATHFVSFGTEAGQFQSAGLSVVVCGPGSIAQAHKPDEFIAISEMTACMDFMNRLTHHLTR